MKSKTGYGLRLKIMGENIFADFDFSLLDSPDYKEDSVREELIRSVLEDIAVRVGEDRWKLKEAGQGNLFDLV